MARVITQNTTIHSFIRPLLFTVYLCKSSSGEVNGKPDSDRVEQGRETGEEDARERGNGIIME